MNMELFRLDKNSPICIYGAGSIGLACASNLLRQGYHIIGFFDMRAKTIHYAEFSVNGKTIRIPVYEFSKEACIPDEVSPEKNPVIMITLRQSAEQNNLAGVLAEMGYSRIIYKIDKMYNFNIQDDALKDLNKIYELIISGDLPDNIELPLYDIEDNRFYENFAIISEAEEEIVLWAPIELIFSVAESVSSGSENNMILKGHCNRHISTIKEYTDLFYSFDVGLDDLSKHLEDFKEILPEYDGRPLKDEMGMADFLNTRYMEYQTYSRALNEDTDFFRESPCHVKWNEKGYFNLLNGYAKAAFMSVKGMKKLPVVMSKKDYIAWRNEDALEAVMDVIKNTGITASYTPIAHPYFNNYPAYREQYGMSRLTLITKFLSAYTNHDFSNFNVLDAGCCHGYFSQQLARLGAKVTGIEMGAKEFALACQLNKLFYLDRIKMHHCTIQDFSADETYDITLLLTVLYWSFGTDECLPILNKIDGLTNQILIWESGNQIEEEKNFILQNSSFKSYEKLSNTFGTGKIRELGVFYKYDSK